LEFRTRDFCKNKQINEDFETTVSKSVTNALLGFSENRISAAKSILNEFQRATTAL